VTFRSWLDLGERSVYPHTIPLPPRLRYASAERRAGLARPRIIRRCVVPRRGIGRRRVIGRRPITHVIEGRCLRDRSKRRRDDCRGGNGCGARRANRPGQCKRRVGGIIFRLGGREQSGELGGERYRTRNSADTHVVSRLGPCTPRPANVVRCAKKKPTRSCGSGLVPKKSATIGAAGSLSWPSGFWPSGRRQLARPAPQRSMPGNALSYLFLVSLPSRSAGVSGRGPANASRMRNHASVTR